MKKLFLFLILLSLGFVEQAYAATPDDEENDEVVLMVVSEMPEFPGGQAAMFKFISENLQYPQEAQDSRIEGRVICQFTVEKNGLISNVTVVRSAGNAVLDKEAVRIIKLMPTWKPGKHRGKLVRVKYTVPINFRLK